MIMKTSWSKGSELAKVIEWKFRTSLWMDLSALDLSFKIHHNKYYKSDKCGKSACEEKVVCSIIRYVLSTMYSVYKKKRMQEMQTL